MKFPKLTIQIVTYNSLKYLPECLKSIYNQTYCDFQVLAIDNDSQDETVKYLRTEYPSVAIFQNNKNLGFSRANNQGIKLLHSPYVLLCNPDIVLEPDFLEKLMTEAELEKNKKVGSFGGKLIRMKIKGDFEQMIKTDKIDSCGLKVLPERQVVELGAGESADKFNRPMAVFGISGALVLYRRQALIDCFIKNKDAPHGEYFDEDFFFYKEDVDLAWRMRLLGWQSMMIPTAVAYHIRTFTASSAKGLKGFIKSRRRQSKLARYFSYRNHIMVLIKNLYYQNFLKSGRRILWYEFKKAIYILFFEPTNIKAWFEVIKLWPKMRRKRKIIMSKAKAEAEGMRQWIK